MKRNPLITLKKLHVGVFEIRLAESQITIQTTDKSWSQTYATKTRPFAELVSLMAKAEAAYIKKDKEEQTRNEDIIHNLCYALYGTTLFFYYPELAAEWLTKYNEFAKGMKDAMEEESKKGVQDEA